MLAIGSRRGPLTRGHDRRDARRYSAHGSSARKVREGCDTSSVRCRKRPLRSKRSWKPFFLARSQRRAELGRRASWEAGSLPTVPTAGQCRRTPGGRQVARENQPVRLLGHSHRPSLLPSCRMMGGVAGIRMAAIELRLWLVRVGLGPSTRAGLRRSAKVADRRGSVIGRFTR